MSTVTRAERASGSPPRARRRRRWPVVLSGLYAAGTAAVLASWAILGDTALTAMVNALTFWWSLPALVLLAVAVVARSWRSAALLAVPAGLWVIAYGGLYVGSPPAGEADLRVASYNTFVQAPDISHVLGFVDEEAPDVLLVQEILPSQRDTLRERIDDRLPHVWFGRPGRVGGVGVLSAYPIVDVRPIGAVARSSRPTAVVTIAVGDERLQVVPVHLTSPCPRCGPVVERQRFEANTRRAETDAIVAALDADTPAVVGGDFNSTRRNDPYRALVRVGFRDPQIEAGSGPGFTWPDGSGPFVRIDWVLARGLEPVAARVGPPRASDHHPVVVDLAFPG